MTTRCGRSVFVRVMCKEWIFPNWLEWAIVALISLLSFLSLSLPNALPAVDLPQHARLVSLIVDHTGDGSLASQGFEFNPVSPYWFFYLFSSGLYFIIGDPYNASQISLALFSAAIIPATAGVLSSLGSRPLYALFSLPAVFSEVMGWGFVGMIAATPFLLLLLMACEYHVSCPKRSTSLFIALLLFILYFCHLFFWFAGVAIFFFFFFLKPFSWRFFYPILVSLSFSSIFLLLFSSTFESTPYFSMFVTSVDLEPRDRLLTNLYDLWGNYIRFGLPVQRSHLMKVFLSLYAIVLLLGFRYFTPNILSLSDGVRAWFYRLRYPLGGVFLFAAQLLAPENFLFSRRLPIFIMLVAPFLLVKLRSLVSNVVLSFSILVSLGVVHDAFSSSQHFSEKTSCLTSMIENINNPGRSLALVFDRFPRGYGLPVKQQIIGFLTSRKGGRPFMDFVYSGVGPIRVINPHTIPDLRTISMHLDARLYSTDSIDHYDTIISSPPLHPISLAGEKADDFVTMICGEYAVLWRRSQQHEERAGK